MYLIPESYSTPLTELAWPVLTIKENINYILILNF